MLKKRIIACLDVVNENVVKGIKFRNQRVVGNMYEFARKYSEQGVDELVFYDIQASAQGRCVSPAVVEKMARNINIPFSVAGGIKSVHEARALLNAGAEKVSVNSMAIEKPEVIELLAAEFGSQAVVVGVDSMESAGHCYVYQYTGLKKTTRKSLWRTKDWLLKVQKLGAGEIVLNVMSSDGVRKGFDINHINNVTDKINIPIVASGGAGRAEDFVQVFMQTNVSGALAASIFHDNHASVGDVRKCIIQNNIPSRRL